MVGLTDNLLMREAAERVYEQAALLCREALRGQDFNALYVRSFFNHDPLAVIRLAVIPEGADRGKIALYERNANGQWVQASGIVPADYANLLMPGEDIATAVRRIQGGRDMTQLARDIVDSVLRPKP